MKLSVVQFCPEFGNKALNTEKLISYCSTISSDIIVFPELCTTGYFFTSKEEVLSYAETNEGKTLRAVQEISTNSDKIIVYGFAECEGEKVYNSAAVVLPQKELTRVYRKTHLFYKERFCFDEGNTGFFVVEDKDKDIRIGAMICYDWRFPEASRSLGLLGADLIVCPSNLVTRIWPLVMPARAIENKVYLAVANRYGIEERQGEKVEFNGQSGIWSYNGSVLVQGAAVSEEVLTADITPQETRNKKFNDFNDIFGDRRPDYYIR